MQDFSVPEISKISKAQRDSYALGVATACPLGIGFAMASADAAHKGRYVLSAIAGTAAMAASIYGLYSAYKWGQFHAIYKAAQDESAGMRNRS